MCNRAFVESEQIVFFLMILQDSCLQPCSLPQLLQASEKSLGTPELGVQEKQHCKGENFCCEER